SGKCSRGSSVRDMVNNDSEYMICSLIIESGSKLYQIIKGIDISVDRAKNITRIIEINNNEGNDENKTKGSNKLTEQTISQILGTYDDLVTTSICTQNDPNHFINKSPIEKNNLICGMLRINILDDYKKI